MSRIGKKLITIPQGVEVTINEHDIVVKGPKGELHQAIHPLVNIIQDEEGIKLAVANESIKEERSLWGTFGSLVTNMITGVTEGYKKELELNGVGFKVALQGKVIILNVGFSHPVEFPVPEGIVATVDKNLITIEGIDKQVVGETAARIRKIKKPEPYKGKGIKYVDEIIKRKAGKTAVSGG